MNMKKKRKVLIIDDDPEIIEKIQKWLFSSHYDVMSALNASVGIERAKKNKPDLILCDLMLPDQGGVDVAKLLRADVETQNIPVVFVTVTMGVELDKGDETIEIDGWLYRIFAKPLHSRKLLSEIRKSINRKIHKNISRIQGS